MARKPYNENIFTNEKIGMPVIEEQKIQPLYTIKVNHPSLRRRSGPSYDANVLGYLTDFGTFDVFEEQNGWGRIGDNEWIKLEFTKKI